MRDAEHRCGAAYFSGGSEEARIERIADIADDALTATILTRLTAAEAARDAAVARAERLEGALMTARSQIITLGGDPGKRQDGDKIQQAVLDTLALALALASPDPE